MTAGHRRRAQALRPRPWPAASSPGRRCHRRRDRGAALPAGAGDVLPEASPSRGPAQARDVTTRPAPAPGARLGPAPKGLVRRRIRRVVAACVLGALGALAAPSAGAQPVAPVLQGPSAGTQPVAPVVPAQPVPLVRMPFPQDDGSLTPYTFELGYPLLTLVYDTLLWRDAGGVPQPWLAQSMDRSPDGRTYTLHLAGGARWHDGSEVTSADVSFTFSYMASRHHLRFTPELGAVERVTTPDPRTVVITLRHPDLGFADQPLADVPILPAHLWRGLPPGAEAPAGLAVGSGPYRLVRYERAGGYRLEAVPDYFRGAPVVKAIEIPIIADPTSAAEALRRRQVDVLPAPLPPSMANVAAELGISTRTGPSYLGTALLLNLRQPPFDQPAVRRAVTRALDLQRLAAAATGGAVAATRGYLHPASPWASGDRLDDFDPPAAREVLAAPGLPPIEVLAPANDPMKAETARQVADALRRAGMAVTARLLPREALAAAVGEDGSAPSFQAAVWTVPALASDDPDLLARLFGSAPADATLNLSGYRSTGFDDAARRIGTETSPEARRTAVADALRLLAHDVPVVPLYFADAVYPYRPEVFDGWVFVKGSGIVDKRSFLEPATKKAGAARVPTDRPIAHDRADRDPLQWTELGALGLAGILGLLGLVRRWR